MNDDRKVVAITYNTSLYVVKFRLDLVQMLQDLGYRVIVIAPEDNYTHKILETGSDFIHWPVSQYGISPIREITSTYKLYKILQKQRPSIALQFTIKPNTFGNIAAKMAGVKVINNIAGAGKGFSSGGFMQWVVKTLYRIGLASSSYVFFQNNEDMNMFLDNKLISGDKFERIPGSGVNLRKFTPEPFNSETRFLFIGRLLTEKGILEFLRAAEEVRSNGQKDFKISIVGEIDDHPSYIDRKEFERYVSHLSAFYHGAVSPEDIPAIIAQAQCVVLPSYYREGVPRSLLEACAMGRPIITTDNVGCRDVLINGVNGFQCKAKDHRSVAQAMLNFIELGYEERKTMGLAARSHAELNFDQNYVLKRYMDVILDVIR